MQTAQDNYIDYLAVLLAKRSEQSELNCTECIHCDAPFKVQGISVLLMQDESLATTTEPPAKQVSEGVVM